MSSPWGIDPSITGFGVPVTGWGPTLARSLTEELRGVPSPGQILRPIVSNAFWGGILGGGISTVLGGFRNIGQNLARETWRGAIWGGALTLVPVLRELAGVGLRLTSVGQVLANRMAVFSPTAARAQASWELRSITSGLQWGRVLENFTKRINEFGLQFHRMWDSMRQRLFTSWEPLLNRLLNALERIASFGGVFVRSLSNLSEVLGKGLERSAWVVEKIGTLGGLAPKLGISTLVPTITGAIAGAAGWGTGRAALAGGAIGLTATFSGLASVFAGLSSVYAIRKGGGGWGRALGFGALAGLATASTSGVPFNYLDIFANPQLSTLLGLGLVLTASKVQARLGDLFAEKVAKGQLFARAKNWISNLFGVRTAASAASAIERAVAGAPPPSEVPAEEVTANKAASVVAATAAVTAAAAAAPKTVASKWGEFIPGTGMFFTPTTPAAATAAAAVSAATTTPAAPTPAVVPVVPTAPAAPATPPAAAPAPAAPVPVAAPAAVDFVQFLRENRAPGLFGTPITILTLAGHYIQESLGWASRKLHLPALGERFKRVLGAVGGYISRHIGPLPVGMMGLEALMYTPFATQFVSQFTGQQFTPGAIAAGMGGYFGYRVLQNLGLPGGTISALAAGYMMSSLVDMMGGGKSTWPTVAVPAFIMSLPILGKIAQLPKIAQWFGQGTFGKFTIGAGAASAFLGALYSLFVDTLRNEPLLPSLGRAGVTGLGSGLGGWGGAALGGALGGPAGALIGLAIGAVGGGLLGDWLGNLLFPRRGYTPLAQTIAEAFKTPDSTKLPQSLRRSWVDIARDLGVPVGEDVRKEEIWRQGYDFMKQTATQIAEAVEVAPVLEEGIKGRERKEESEIVQRVTRLWKKTHTLLRRRQILSMLDRYQLQNLEVTYMW